MNTKASFVAQSLSTESGNVELHQGKKAFDEFNNLLSRHWEEDSTGHVYKIYRVDSRLEMIGLAGCAQEKLFLDIRDNEISDDLETVIIDSGNSSGDSWKATLHVKTKTMLFVYESEIVADELRVV